MLIQKGEKFYAEDGSLYCTALRDIRSGEPAKLSDFDWAHGIMKPGTSIKSEEFAQRVKGHKISFTELKSRW